MFSFEEALEVLLYEAKDKQVVCRKWLRGRLSCSLEEWQLCQQILHSDTTTVTSNSLDELPF